MSGARRDQKTVTFSRSVYERLLAAYPKRFRELYGEDMVDLFEDECLEQVQSGGLSRLLWVWFRALADLLGNAALERRRLSIGFSVVRLGGLLAVAGGMLLAVSSLLMSWLLSVQTWSYVWNIASAGQIVGMLLLAVSLTGLVSVVARHGDSGIPSVQQGQLQEQQEHSLNIRRFTGAQWTAVAGVFLVVVAVLSTIVMMAAFVMYELIGVGNLTGAYPGDLERFLLPALGAMVTFGPPLALTLLGVAVWRSGIMGRWSLLPMRVGMATFLVTLAAFAAVQVLWVGALPPSSFLTTLVIVGLPQAIIGIMWALLGLTLIKSENAGRALEPRVNN